MKSLPFLSSVLAAMALPALLGSCTSEPLISRKGVSGVAVGEMGIEALMVMAAMGGGVPETPDHFGNFEINDTHYIGGIIPIKRSAGNSRVDNGTRLRVDGRKRGFLPRILKLDKPGPHVVRLEIPAYQPYTLTVSQTIRLRLGQEEIEAWTPVIVDCLSGDIFTAAEASTIHHDRNSGRRTAPELSKHAGRKPILIVTTCDRRHPGWKKIGQLTPAWQGGVGSGVR